VNHERVIDTLAEGLRTSIVFGESLPENRKQFLSVAEALSIFPFDDQKSSRAVRVIRPPPATDHGGMDRLSTRQAREALLNRGFFLSELKGLNKLGCPERWSLIMLLEIVDKVERTSSGGAPVPKATIISEMIDKTEAEMASFGGSEMVVEKLQVSPPRLICRLAWLRLALHVLAAELTTRVPQTFAEGM